VGRRYAERIMAAASRLDRIVQDLLRYSRLRRAEIRLKPVSLDAVVGEVLAGRETAIESAGAEVAVESPLPDVMAHRPTLVQIVENLLDNALKFVARGVAPRVRVRAEPDGSMVRLFVEDNGIGIAPEQRERIFKVFERLHGVEAYPGSGLGLAIVRKAAERMGGHAGVESEPGRGSRFWVALEAQRGAPTPPGQGRREAGEEAGEP
jgi:signal transduction histidine kinase